MGQGPSHTPPFYRLCELLSALVCLNRECKLHESPRVSVKVGERPTGLHRREGVLTAGGGPQEGLLVDGWFPLLLLLLLLLLLQLLHVP